MQPLEKVRLALTTICDNVGQYSTSKKPYPRISWEVTGAKGLRADNATQAQVFQGYIHLFSQNAEEPLFLNIQKVLNGAGVSYKLSSVQYEDETSITHWEWAFEVI